MMKKILTYLIILSTALFFAGCEPLVNEIDMGELITDASQIDATITPVLKDGKVSNKLLVECKSPVLCQWSSDGGKPFIRNNGAMSLSKPGQQTITLTARAADGKMMTKTFPPINVEVMEEPEWNYIFGSSGTKEWTWNTSWVVPGTEAIDGIDVGPIILAPAEPTSITDFAAFFAFQTAPFDPNEGAGAKMKFSLNGTTVAKYNPSGMEIENGTVILELGPTTISGSLGILTFVNTNVLYPYDILGLIFGGPLSPLPTSTFTICYLDDAHMVLHVNAGFWGYYYIFTAMP
ncbi:MAG: hypothetical protein LBU42_00005 [Prevotellaceae bacterium]|jgi:hypothetical protein|nr:hypothetical protein [Prevotellaceae bacterium]